ncbi:MAG: hypothetical protein KGL39_27025 [Patescibacteria group bacterium]|nr:hypothetical protein [Patescibacteria group bacterium]
MAKKKPDKRPPWRPTKYKPEFCQQIVDYFSEWDIVEKIVDSTGRGGTTTHYETVRVPSIYGFAARIGVNQDTLREWANGRYPDDHKNKSLRGKLKHPDFSVSFRHAQGLEDAIVHEYGMAGRLDRGLATLYFTNKLKYKDSRHIDMTSDGERLQTAPAVVSVIAARPNDDAQTQPETS